MEAGMAKKPSYSFSKLEMDEKCPWAYQKVYIERIPRAETEPLLIGKTLHDLAAKYLDRLIGAQLQTDWEFAEGLTPKEAPFDVFEIWPRFFNSFILPDPMENPGVELKLAFDRNWKPTEYFGDDAFFRMVVDLTYRQGGLVVVQDWKSNRAIPEALEKNLQLRIYGWGIRQDRYPDAQEILLRLHFLRYGAEREVLLLPDDLATVPDDLEERIGKIESRKNFEPTPGSFCGWCGVTAHCPVMAQALVPANIMYPVSREDATKAATLLLAIKTMEAEIKDHLKKFVKKVGPVQVGDIVYGPKPSTKYEFDPKEVTEYLINDCGLSNEDAWSLLKLGKTHLESSLKKLRRKDLIDPVLALAQTMPTESIEFFKVK
jgi:hypothetical protein